MPAQLKRRLQGHKSLRLALSRARRMILVGPIRPIIVGYYRKTSRPKPIKTAPFVDLGEFSHEDAVNGLRDNGIATGAMMSESSVDQLLECYASNPVSNYTNPHADHELVREIAADDRLIAVARDYLGAEPILLSSMFHTYDPATSSDADYYHFDVGDAMTMTFFVFLTDVDEEKGVTHELIRGTHRSKTIRELWDCTITDVDAESKYPGQVEIVAGKRGTAWFEDVIAFHKHGHVGQCRKMLSLQYSLHRQP